MTLTEFLLARIAEDERERFALISPWLDKRWQAECAAKRRIVAETPVTGHLLSLLALPYAEHQDYREEWRQ